MQIDGIEFAEVSRRDVDKIAGDAIKAWRGMAADGWTVTIAVVLDPDPDWSQFGTLECDRRTGDAIKVSSDPRCYQWWHPPEGESWGALVNGWTNSGIDRKEAECRATEACRQMAKWRMGEGIGFYGFRCEVAREGIVLGVDSTWGYALTDDHAYKGDSFEADIPHTGLVRNALDNARSTLARLCR